MFGEVALQISRARLVARDGPAAMRADGRRARYESPPSAAESKACRPVRCTDSFSTGSKFRLVSSRQPFHRLRLRLARLPRSSGGSITPIL